MNIIQSVSSRIRDCLVLAALLIGGVSAACAATINVSTSSALVNVGQTFTVFFDVAGLSAAPNSSLSSFDIDVLYDPAVAALTGFSFIDPATAANQLDFAEPGSFGFSGAVLPAGGLLDAFGLTGNSASILDANQPDAFRFLSLTFNALATTALTTIGIDLADPNLLFVDSGAGLLNVTYRNSAVSVAIGQQSNAVPEPSITGLLAIALLAMFVAIRLPGTSVRQLRTSIRVGALALAALAASGSALAGPTADFSGTQQPTLIAQASQQAIDGVVIAIEGQRIYVRTGNGSSRWLTVKDPVASAYVGKRVTGVVVPAGDTSLLTQPKFH